MAAATKDSKSARDPSEAPPREAAAGPVVENQNATPNAFAKRGPVYTMTAQEAVSAAELVNAALGRKTIGKLLPRRIEVIAPDGPSTAGGKRARQTIRLVPIAGTGTPVMVGVLDVARKQVELRRYEVVAKQYEERFGAPFELTAAEHAALCKELETTLSVFRYGFTQASETHAAGHSVRAKLTADAGITNARVLNAVLLGIALAIATGVVLAMVLR